MYELKLEQFSGPVEKLLELIEGKKLEITELNLAQITAEFLEYLKTIEKAEPRLLADFVVVAARLLLIKSKALLPEFQLTAEEEQGIDELKQRLIFYQNFKPAIKHLQELWVQKHSSFSRPLFAGRQVIFYPSENITAETLQQAVEEIFKVLKEFSLETQIIKSKVITLEEKIQEIVDRLKSGLKDFNELIKGKGRTEIIVLFLALLHLLSRQMLQADQDDSFSDIIINSMEHEV